MWLRSRFRSAFPLAQASLHSQARTPLVHQYPCGLEKHRKDLLILASGSGRNCHRIMGHIQESNPELLSMSYQAEAQRPQSLFDVVSCQGRTTLTSLDVVSPRGRTTSTSPCHPMLRKSHLNLSPHRLIPRRSFLTTSGQETIGLDQAVRTCAIPFLPFPSQVLARPAYHPQAEQPEQLSMSSRAEAEPPGDPPISYQAEGDVPTSTFLDVVSC